MTHKPDAVELKPLKDELREAATDVKTSEVERTWQAYLTLPYRSKSEYKALVHGYAAGCEAGKPKWIPVSERLPELKDMGGYQKDEVYTCSQMEDGTKWYAVGRFSLERQQFIANSYVVAWMPTPPYTEGE